MNWIGIFNHAASQQLDSTKNSADRATGHKPEVLNSGFIDVINNGQMNASARLIRIYIGEPGKFALPLCIYSGVSSNNFQSQQNGLGQRTNEQLVAHFINPLSGLSNISINGIGHFGKKKVKITKPGLIYQLGIRVLTGFKTGPVLDPFTGKPVNFLNLFGVTGLYFQTGAWEKNNARNVGISWIAFRYIASQSGTRQLENIVSGIATNGMYHGWSLGWGIEINNLVNLKLIYYKYVKAPEFDLFQPIYQFSFNYSFKN